ncbi:MAG: alanine:cation symporter family protein [Phascolarctobacterium faecium]
MKLIFTARNTGNGDINSFKALCTALAATVGTGIIVGALQRSRRWSRSVVLDGWRLFRYGN